MVVVNDVELFLFPLIILFFFLMSYIRNIIDENGKRNIQCVNENEHSRAQNRTPQKNNQETKLRKEKN